MGRIARLLLFFLCLSGPVWSAPTPEAANPAGKDSGEAIRISADRLETDDSLRQVVFSGNVVARRGDLVIHSEKMTLHYGQDGKRIDRTVATGKVRILQEERVATGEQAIFYREEGKIVLTGSPRISEGNNFVEGEEITVLIDENRSFVKGGRESRVKAVFQPDKEER